MIKIAIIGCGRVAQHYRKILLGINQPNYQIVYACDINIDKAKDFSKYFKNCLPIIDFSLIKNTDVNLVIICTESGNHHLHARHFLKKGINVLVEKPITMIPEDAYELVKLSNQFGVILCVAFQNRFNKAIQKLKEDVTKKIFGKINTVSVVLRWCRFQEYYEDGWHGTWKNDGGVINQQAIHHIDVLNWIFGPILKVSSISSNMANKLEAEDTLVAIFKTKSGITGTIECTTALRPKDLEASINLVGQNGYAKVSGTALNIYQERKVFKGNKEDINLTNFSEEVENGYGNGHKDLLINLFARINQGVTISPVPAIEAISTLEVIHALYYSSENFKWAEMKNKPVSKRLGIG